MAPYHINVEWDEEGRVWVATSDDVPGLATGSDTFEALVEKLRVVVPELPEENGLIEAGGEEVPIVITAPRARLQNALGSILCVLRGSASGLAPQHEGVYS